MATHQARPLSRRERERLRALHLADQAAGGLGSTDVPPAGPPHGAVLVVAYALVLVFLIAGGYAVGTTLGLVPAVAGSAIATTG